MRHNGRTGVSEGSCFIFSEVPNESTPVFIPINPKGPDFHGSPGSLNISQGSKHSGRKRKRERKEHAISSMMMGIMGVLAVFIFVNLCRYIYPIHNIMPFCPCIWALVSHYICILTQKWKLIIFSLQLIQHPPSSRSGDRSLLLLAVCSRFFIFPPPNCCQP